MEYKLTAESGFINFSPVGFRVVARDLYRCAVSFNPSKFSLVPYFFYCRAIELALKALHLENRRQSEVKKSFGHNLILSYNALAPDQRTLAADDLALLSQVSDLYVKKAFEYMHPGDAATAFRNFPELKRLGRLASLFAS